MSARTRSRKQNESAFMLPLQRNRSLQDVRKLVVPLSTQLCDAAAKGDLTLLQKLLNEGAQVQFV